jgi:hypothetical protein
MKPRLKVANLGGDDSDETKGWLFCTMDLFWYSWNMLNTIKR